MPEEEIIENDFNEFEILERHVYPAWVYLFGLSSLFIFLCVAPNFIWNELPRHRQLSAQLIAAERSFSNKDYIRTIELYDNILTEYPTYKKAKMRTVQSFFALSANGKESEEYFYAGLGCLEGGKYTNAEIAKLCSSLPVEYQENFNSYFEDV